MKSFITGSRAYGKPCPDSDVDLVIRCDEGLSEFLRSVCDISETRAEATYHGRPCQIRFGRLNIIDCNTDEEFAAWKLGTSRLEDKSPVTRATAVAFLRYLCDECAPKVSPDDEALLGDPGLILNEGPPAPARREPERLEFGGPDSDPDLS